MSNFPRGESPFIFCHKDYMKGFIRDINNLLSMLYVLFDACNSDQHTSHQVLLPYPRSFRLCSVLKWMVILSHACQNFLGTNNYKSLDQIFPQVLISSLRFCFLFEIYHNPTVTNLKNAGFLCILLLKICNAEVSFLTIVHHCSHLNNEKSNLSQAERCEHQKKKFKSNCFKGYYETLKHLQIICYCTNMKHCLKFFYLSFFFPGFLSLMKPGLMKRLLCSC